MIKIVFNDEKIEIPKNITQTTEIFMFISARNNILCDKLLLCYNSTYIRHNEKIHLTDIGYSFGDELTMIINEDRTAIFKILPFNYDAQFIINKSTTIFDVKKRFSIDFFTVPQNINIKLNNDKLRDDIILFDQIQINSPFEIEAEDGYALYYTFCQSFFRFICMPLSSTIENLEDAISIYTQKSSFSIQNRYSFKNQNIDPQTLLQELPKSSKPLEFELNSNQLPEFTITVSPNSDTKILPKLTIKSRVKMNAYSLTCLLEHLYKIDRQLFNLIDNRCKSIKPTSNINDRVNNSLKFDIEDTFQAKIIQNPKEPSKVENFSYFTTISYIQEKYNFNTTNFGIIINKRFVFQSKEKPFLINFLNYSTDKSEIIIKKAKCSCHEKQYLKYESDEVISQDRFIVPDSMSPEEAMKKYVKRNYHAVNIVNKNQEIEDPNDIHYELSPLTIKIKFISNKKEEKEEELTIEIKELNPRVGDLFNYLFTQRKSKNFIDDKVKYKAFFNDSEIDFFIELSNVYYDDENLITVYEESDKVAKIIKIHDLQSTDSKEIKHRQTSVLTTKELLEELSLKDTNMYLRYNILRPNDYPTIYNFIASKEFLIINKDEFDCHINISNRIFTIKPGVEQKEENQNFAEVIQSLFGLRNIESKFLLEQRDGEIKLPSNFNSGSLPNECTIYVEYFCPRIEFITINYKGNRHFIPISDPTLPIYSFNQQIMKSLKCYEYSYRSLRLSFHNNFLSSKYSFEYFKITSDAELRITSSQNSISIELSTRNDEIMKPYCFTPEDTIQDLKQHLQEEYKYKYDIDIYLQGDKKPLEDNENLSEDMELVFSSQKRRLKYQNTTFSVDDILQVSEVNQFIQQKFNQNNIFIFIKSLKEDSFVIADNNKRLFEYEQEMFIHQIIPSIEFSGYDIKIDEYQKISERNNLSFLKKTFLCSKMLINMNKLLIKRDREIVDETTNLKFLLEGMKLTIEINEANTNSIQDKTSPRKPQSSKVKYNALELINTNKSDTKTETDQSEDEGKDQDDDKCNDACIKENFEKLAMANKPPAKKNANKQKKTKTMKKKNNQTFSEENGKEAMGEDLDNLNITKRKSTSKNQKEVKIEEEEDEPDESNLIKSKNKNNRKSKSIIKTHEEVNFEEEEDEFGEMTITKSKGKSKSKSKTHEEVNFEEEEDEFGEMSLTKTKGKSKKKKKT